MHQNDLLTEEDFFVGLLLDQGDVLVPLRLQSLFIVLGVLFHVLVVDLETALGEQLEEPVPVVVNFGDMGISLVENIC